MKNFFKWSMGFRKSDDYKVADEMLNELIGKDFSEAVKNRDIPNCLKQT